MCTVTYAPPQQEVERTARLVIQRQPEDGLIHSFTGLTLAELCLAVQLLFTWPVDIVLTKVRRSGMVVKWLLACLKRRTCSPGLTLAGQQSLRPGY